MATKEYLTMHTKESTMLISRRVEDISLLDTICFILSWEKFTAALFWKNRREKPESINASKEKSLRITNVIVRGLNGHTAENLETDPESLSKR